MIANLQIEISEWANRNFKDRLPHQPLLGIIEEVGELAHAHLKTEQGIRGTVEQHKLNKVDAVGDIFIYLADYCTLNNISLEIAIHDTWEKVKQRDWKKNKEIGHAMS